MSDAATQIAIEQAKLKQKNPVVLWLVNFIWPGLGNIVIGQVGMGIGFGILHLILVFIAVVTLGIGLILCFINWIVASLMGQSKINKQLAEELAKISGGIK